MGKKIFGFEKNIFYLSLTSFFTDISSEIIYPLLPLFLTSVLGAGVAFVGLVEGFAETTASMLKLFSGWFSDKLRRRKPFVVFGYTLSSVARPLAALAFAPWNILVIRILDRVGKGLRNAPRDALIADSCEPREKGRAFGFNRAMDNAGAMIGSLIVFFLLLRVTGNYRLIFAWAALPAFFAVMTVIFGTRDVLPGPLPAANGAGLSAKSPAERPARYDARFKGFVGAVLLFTLGNSSDAFLLLRARDLKIGVAFIPLLWCLLHVVKTFGSVPFGIISDKIGRSKVIIAGWMVYGAVYCGFALAGSALQIWLLFAAYGLFYALTEGVERAFIADLVGSRRRGSAFGIYNFVIGIAALPASLLMGALWQVFGPRVAFFTGASLAVAASLLFLLTVVRPAAGTVPS
ncbi:MAG: MFS transporter [Candidatus Omnitrophota bacterium]